MNRKAIWVWKNWTSNQSDKWYFADEASLLAAYPTWVDWWFAVVWATNTMWVWSSNTWAWLNTNWVTPISPIDPPINDILLTPPVWPTLWDTYLINWVWTWAWATHDFETVLWDWAAWIFTSYVQGNVITVIWVSDPENYGLWILWATEREQYGKTLDPVIDISLANPASPALWDRYLINWTGTGLFATHNFEIAEWNWAAWEFTAVDKWDTVQVLWRPPAFTNTWIWIKGITLRTKQNVVLEISPNPRPIKWSFSMIRNTLTPIIQVYNPISMGCFVSAKNAQAGAITFRMYPISTSLINNFRHLVGWETVVHCRADSVVPITVVARTAASVICVVQPWETYRIIAADPTNPIVAAWRAFEKLDVWLTPDQRASLATSQLLIYPQFGLSTDLKEVVLLWEANFTSKGDIRYDFPQPTMPQIAISWGWFARGFAYQATVNTTTELPEYNWVISDEIDTATLNPPILFGADSVDWAIVLFTFIMINVSWWTLTTGIDWEADWFIVNLLEAPWINRFMFWSPYFYFNGTSIVNKNDFMFANIGYLAWDVSLDFEFIDGVVIPNWQEYEFYIAHLDEEFWLVPQSSQAENIVWVVWLNNTTWVDFTIGTDPLSDLAWDMLIITYSWDNFIGSWADEAAVTAGWWFVSEWKIAYFTAVAIPWSYIFINWVRVAMGGSGGSSKTADFYVSATATPNADYKIYDDWALMFADTAAINSVVALERIYIWRDSASISINEPGSFYFVTNMEFYAYNQDSDYAQAELVITNNVPDPLEFSLPAKIDNIDFIFDSVTGTPFYSYTTGNERIKLELTWTASINTTTPDYSYLLSNGSSMEFTFRDTSGYLDSSWPFIARDTFSTVIVHLYDNAVLEANFTSGGNKDGLIIHLHSPSARIDESYYGFATIIHYGRATLTKVLESRAENPQSITGYTWVDATKQMSISIPDTTGYFVWGTCYVIAVTSTWPGSANMTLLKIIWVSGSDITLQYPIGHVNPWTWSSGGTVWARQSKYLGEINETYWLPWQWFEYSISWVTASNSDDKKITLLLRQKTTGNTISAFTRILAWAESNDIDYMIRGVVLQQESAAVVWKWTIKTYWATPIDVLHSTANWASLLQWWEIYLIVDGTTASDVIVNVLSINPA